MVDFEVWPHRADRLNCRCLASGGRRALRDPSLSQPLQRSHLRTSVSAPPAHKLVRHTSASDHKQSTLGNRIRREASLSWRRLVAVAGQRASTHRVHRESMPHGGAEWHAPGHLAELRRATSAACLVAAASAACAARLVDHMRSPPPPLYATWHGETSRGPMCACSGQCMGRLLEGPGRHIAASSGGDFKVSRNAFDRRPSAMHD